MLFNHFYFLFNQVLKLLINFVDNSDEETWKGYLYALLLFANQALSTILFQNYTSQVPKLFLKCCNLQQYLLFLMLTNGSIYCTIGYCFIWGIVINIAW